MVTQIVDNRTDIETLLGFRVCFLLPLHDWCVPTREQSREVESGWVLKSADNWKQEDKVGLKRFVAAFGPTQVLGSPDMPVPLLGVLQDTCVSFQEAPPSLRGLQWASDPSRAITHRGRNEAEPMGTNPYSVLFSRMNERFLFHGNRGWFVLFITCYQTFSIAHGSPWNTQWMNE